MLFNEVLKGILLLTFFKVIPAAPAIEDCAFVCDENDKNAVCVLDKSEFCFRTLPSKCMNCIFQMEYVIDYYCELEAFKCKDALIFQSPPADSEQIEYHESFLDEVKDIFANDYDNDNEVK